MKGHVFTPGKQYLTNCKKCKTAIPDSHKGNYQVCDACAPEDDSPRQLSIKSRATIKRIRNKLKEQTKHWNIKDGLEKLEEMFPEYLQYAKVETTEVDSSSKEAGPQS